jgi:hypothetical protein
MSTGLYKSGYSCGTGVLKHADNCAYIRRTLGINQQSDDLLAEELGDVALASIFRFWLLRALLYSSDVALSCLAAGVIGAARSLDPRYYLISTVAGAEWTTDEEYLSWPSAIVKYAGAHMRRLHTGKGQDASLAWSDATSDIYACHFNCMQRSLASTVSDDADIDRQTMLRLYEQGVLMRPTPKAWSGFCQRVDLLTGNCFHLRAGVPGCRLSFKFANGNPGTKPWAPARTMSMLDYASAIMPAVAFPALHGTGVIRDGVRASYAAFASERQRFAMWVCGNSPEPAAQLQCFDLLVASLFDRLPYVPKSPVPPDHTGAHRFYNKAWLYCDRWGNSLDEQATNIAYPWVKRDGSTVAMRLPPWSGSGGVACPNITPTSIGVLDTPT